MAAPDMDMLLRYESGGLSDNEVIDFFATLIESGMAWELTITYSVTASLLIEAGFIDHDGNVLGYV